MDSSLVPANTKKATLILGLLRKSDLYLVIGGLISTIILLFLLSPLSPTIQILALIPFGLTVLLVMPIPQYHNTLCAIQSILDYYNNRQKYIWRGWCTYYEYKKEGK